MEKVFTSNETELIGVDEQIIAQVKAVVYRDQMQQ